MAGEKYCGMVATNYCTLMLGDVRTDNKLSQRECVQFGSVGTVRDIGSFFFKFVIRHSGGF